MNLEASKISNLPSRIGVGSGGLPINYEHAKKALAICERVDEVKEWGDRAAAIASYARQKRDRTMLDLANRIRARASRRLGELLNEHARSTGRPVSKVARACGVQIGEANTARQVARVPHKTFEDAVEHRNPPMPLSAVARLSVRPSGSDQSEQIWKLLDRVAQLMREFPERSVVESIAANDEREGIAIKRAIGKAVDYFDAVAQAAEKRL